MTGHRTREKLTMGNPHQLRRTRWDLLWAIYVRHVVSLDSFGASPDGKLSERDQNIVG